MYMFRARLICFIKGWKFIALSTSGNLKYVRGKRKFISIETGKQVGTASIRGETKPLDWKEFFNILKLPV
jgi:hypothetical protein